MKDSIATRISRIITGTANTIVSRIEGLAPELVLEQAIDEVDDAIEEVRAELGQITAQKHHVTKAMTRLNQEFSQLDSQVEIAYQQGRKDLVEAALARQTDIEDQLPTLEAQLARLSGQDQEHSQGITGLIAKRNEMENELADFRASKASAASASGSDGEAGPRAGSAADKASRAERAFSRVLQRETGVRRESLAASGKESAKLLELANLGRAAKIEAKMKALEDRMSAQGGA